MRKLKYLFWSGLRTLCRRGRQCPSCGSSDSEAVDRKWLVTSLRRCSGCRLLFRSPATSVGENERLYQERYSSGITTDLPGEDQLRELISGGFRGHPKDWRPYIEVLEFLGASPGGRILDFGSSWGYGSWQLREAGYRVEAYEVSARRADFAREKFRIPVHSKPDFLPGHYDIFFSAHVIEHVPSVSGMIEVGLRALRPGGLFVAFTPNASSERFLNDNASLHRLWGYVHPQLLDREFIEALPYTSLCALSSPYDLDYLQAWNGRGRKIGRMDGPELLLVIRNSRTTEQRGNRLKL